MQNNDLFFQKGIINNRIETDETSLLNGAGTVDDGTVETNYVFLHGSAHAALAARLGVPGP